MRRDVRLCGFALLTLLIVSTGARAECPVRLEPGATAHELTADLDAPRLWWPAGLGPRHFYSVEAVAAAGGLELSAADTLTAIRVSFVSRTRSPVRASFMLTSRPTRPR